MTVSRSALQEALLDAWAVLMPTECSGCGSPDRALCPACACALHAAPKPATRGTLTVWSALDYSDVVGRVLVAYKDGGRTDCARPLAVALRAAIAAALAAAEPGSGGILLVTVPSSRRAWRARGFHPVDLLLKRAGLTPTRLLRPRPAAGRGGPRGPRPRTAAGQPQGHPHGRAAAGRGPDSSRGRHRDHRRDSVGGPARASRCRGRGVGRSHRRRDAPAPGRHLPFTGNRLTKSVTYPAGTTTVVPKARTNRPDQGRFARSGGRHGNKHCRTKPGDH
jgi:hypothetical protein